MKWLLQAADVTLQVCWVFVSCSTNRKNTKFHFEFSVSFSAQIYWARVFLTPTACNFFLLLFTINAAKVQTTDEGHNSFAYSVCVVFLTKGKLFHIHV